MIGTATGSCASEGLPDPLIAGPIGTDKTHLAIALGVEAAGAPRVLEEAPREAWVQRVGPGHSGRDVVDDEVAGHVLEAGPGRLQALDHRVQRLARGGPDEAVPRSRAQTTAQRPHRAPAARARDP